MTSRKEPLAQDETLAPELAQSLERLGRLVFAKAERDRRSGKADEPEAPPPLPAKVVQLDFWEDGKRAAPNALLRSSLFPALNAQQKEIRRFFKAEKLFSVANLSVEFTGEQFDQSDLDVYLELLNMARPYPLGQPVKFSAYALLKALGLTTGGDNHKRLHSVLIRLRGGTIDITDHKIRFFGGLIEGGFRDELTLNYEITINPKFAVLFGFGMWATIDREQRRALGRSATAKALHAYYSSHAAPAAHSFDTLAELAGLTNSNKRQRRADIIKAHDRLKDSGFLEGYEVQGETIKAHIRHTSGQLKHIAKKARKPRQK